jgi:hypothetical protein
MLRHRTNFAAALMLLAAITGPAAAQDSTPAQAERPKPCTTAEHRRFDFWLGDWDVHSKAGDGSPRTAHNRITSMHGGCVILEEYDTPGGYAGTSLNFYDTTRKRWHQTWIDNQGQPLYLSGGLQNGSMVLQSEPAGDGAVQRITWTPRDDGSVRQHWESTTDGGKKWKTAFDGTYTRRR